MAPNKCAYFMCNYTSAQKPMFRFPSGDPKRLQVWLSNCGNKTIAHLSHDELRNRYLCLEHFDDKFVQNKGGRRTRINKNALPRHYKEIISQYSPIPSTSRGLPMPLTLYYMAGSAPCHHVMLVARALGLDLRLQHLDLTKDEHLDPEYVKLNPQHTIPTLVDGDFVLWESRAISRYLVNKYGGDSKLYPVEPEARARVDQRLDFDFGTLYDRFADYFYPQLFYGAAADEYKLKKLEEALGWLDQFLGSSRYVAGEELTIADLATVSSVSVFDAMEMDFKVYPNISRWFDLMKSQVSGYQEIVQKNLEGFSDLVKQIKNSPSS